MPPHLDKLSLQGFCISSTELTVLRCHSSGFGSSVLRSNVGNVSKSSHRFILDVLNSGNASGESKNDLWRLERFAAR